MLPLRGYWGNQRSRSLQLMLRIHHPMEREEKEGEWEGRSRGLFWKFLLLRSCAQQNSPSPTAQACSTLKKDCLCDVNLGVGEQRECFFFILWGEIHLIKRSCLDLGFFALSLVSKYFPNLNMKQGNPEFYFSIFYSCLNGKAIPHQYYHHQHESPLFQLQSDSEGILSFAPPEDLSLWPLEATHSLTMFLYRSSLLLLQKRCLTSFLARTLPLIFACARILFFCGLPPLFLKLHPLLLCRLYPFCCKRHDPAALSVTELYLSFYI